MSYGNNPEQAMANAIARQTAAWQPYLDGQRRAYLDGQRRAYLDGQRAGRAANHSTNSVYGVLILSFLLCKAVLFFLSLIFSYRFIKTKIFLFLILTVPSGFVYFKYHQKLLYHNTVEKVFVYTLYNEQGIKKFNAKHKYMEMEHQIYLLYKEYNQLTKQISETSNVDAKKEIHKKLAINQSDIKKVSHAAHKVLLQESTIKDAGYNENTQRIINYIAIKYQSLMSIANYLKLHVNSFAWGRLLDILRLTGY